MKLTLRQAIARIRDYRIVVVRTNAIPVAEMKRILTESAKFVTSRRRGA